MREKGGRERGERGERGRERRRGRLSEREVQCTMAYSDDSVARFVKHHTVDRSQVTEHCTVLEGGREGGS